MPKPLFIAGRKLLFGTLESFMTYDLPTGKPSSDTTAWNRRGCTTPRASTYLVKPISNDALMLVMENLF